MKTVSCIIVDDEKIAREVLNTHISKINNVDLIAECKNAFEAFNFIRNNHVDLIFLDINMPEISGIAFAKSINSSIKIIFTTAYRDFAVEGFDLQAVDYLLKPIPFERLMKSINRYFNIAQPQESNSDSVGESNQFIFVRSDRKMIKVNYNSIFYIESFSDYIKIHLNGKSIVTRETISAIEAKLPQKDFLRIHRSFIVCLSKIDSFTNESICINNKALTISRSYKQQVLKKLEEY